MGRLRTRSGARANNIYCLAKSGPDVPALTPGTPRFFGQIEGGKTAFMQIIVRDNNVDQALRALKKKLQREGVYREMKLRRHYEKPSEKRARERAAAIRRARKLERKRIEREGAR
jgi:small subunit ribosomal protein S21